MRKALLNGAFIAAALMVCWASADAQRKGGATCSGSQLSLKEAEGEGDMGGKVFGNYVFTNTSSKACTISGFPAFVLLDKSGRMMRGVKVEYGKGYYSDVPKAVMIEPKQTAWFQIFYNSGMPFNLKKSPPSSAKIKVTLPKAAKPVMIKSEIAPYRTVTVSPIRSGLPS